MRMLGRRHDEQPKNSVSTSTTLSSLESNGPTKGRPPQSPPSQTEVNNRYSYTNGNRSASTSPSRSTTPTKPSRREQLAKIRFASNKKKNTTNNCVGNSNSSSTSSGPKTPSSIISSASGSSSSRNSNGLPPRRSVMKSMKKALGGGRNKSTSSKKTQQVREQQNDPAETTFDEVKGLHLLDEVDNNAISSSIDRDTPEFSPTDKREVVEEKRTTKDTKEPFPTPTLSSHIPSNVGIERVLSKDLSPPQSRPPPPSQSPQTSPKSPPQIPASWQKRQYAEQMKQLHQREILSLEHERAGQRRQLKERDGFCRRVDSYDGQIITVDGTPTYELGNYLGGGVAGVVYEGLRLRPRNEYPIRTPRGLVVNPVVFDGNDEESISGMLSPASRGAIEMDIAIEIPTANSRSFGADSPVVDVIDAPSRSRHAARAASTRYEEGMLVSPEMAGGGEEVGGDGVVLPLGSGPDETVAVKILNPVGFRLLQPTATQSAVVVTEGDVMETDVLRGFRPMEERHVWWIVNPNSRNLRTLLRQPSALEGSGGGRVRSGGDIVDRGTEERGLRLSLVAAFKDEKGVLRELPLTRCLEIWGHAPFGTSEAEFEEMMDAIERVNAGHPPANPAKNPANDKRINTGGTEATTSTETSYLQSNPLAIPNTPKKVATGLVRAAASKRQVIYCPTLNAYIAVPAVPPKFLRWLRQRRAATKEIRNMMRIGRHRNIVHLYEVLELIQESKSTMFLILELVKGGELFDLISSNSTSPNNLSHRPGGGGGWDEAEVIMLKFFRELASGISYCHDNGIAHRDLKPENLLVHNGPGGERTLKIADFGLSAAFALHHQHDPNADIIGAYSRDISVTSSKMSLVDRNIYASQSENPQMMRPHTTNTSPNNKNTSNNNPSSPVTSLTPLISKMTKFSEISANALSFLTCGATLDNACHSIPFNTISPNPAITAALPQPLRRMTSIVGSPHYVAPEIISQSTTDHDSKSGTSVTVGYDGTKADVWSAGVILYAMLFRSLPFGEDLLRCPRYQSYDRWYRDARRQGGRRSCAEASLTDDYEEGYVEEQLGPHWFFPGEASMESRDLIVAMLNPDPFERLNVEQVIRHPWLVKMERTRGRTDDD